MGKRERLEDKWRSDCSLTGDTNPDAGDKVTALVLTITGQNTASAAYDENAGY